MHLAQPGIVESYIQEIGHAGCNGTQSVAMLILVKVKGIMMHHAELVMKQYISNQDICRRHLL